MQVLSEVSDIKHTGGQTALPSVFISLRFGFSTVGAVVQTFVVSFMFLEIYVHSQNVASMSFRVLLYSQ
jgi:hypothetical protein